MTSAWGSEIRRRRGPVPFKCYEPRPHRVTDLLANAARWAARTHLVQGRRRITFSAMADAVERVAGHLAGHGVGPGDRVMLLAPNSPEWVVTLWASVRIGAIAALGNGWWSPGEIAHTVGLVDPRLVIAGTSRSALLPAGYPDDHVIDVGTVRSWVDGQAPATAAPPVPDGHEDDPAVLTFTAGTTGFPQAVVLAHRSVIANCTASWPSPGACPTRSTPPSRAPSSSRAGPCFTSGDSSRSSWRCCPATPWSSSRAASMPARSST